MDQDMENLIICLQSLYRGNHIRKAIRKSVNEYKALQEEYGTTSLPIDSLHSLGKLWITNIGNRCDLADESDHIIYRHDVLKQSIDEDHNNQSTGHSVNKKHQFSDTVPDLRSITTEQLKLYLGDLNNEKNWLEHTIMERIQSF